MDSPTTSSAIPRRKFRPVLRFVFSALGIFFLISVLWLMQPKSSYERFVWLTAAQFSQATKPGLNDKLRRSVKKWFAPLLQRYYANKPIINAGWRIMSFSPAVVEQARLGMPAGASTNGMYAWILSSPEAISFSQQLKTNPGISVGATSAILTRNGTQARDSVGSSLIIARHKKSIFGGITLEVFPKISADAVNLLVSASASGGSYDETADRVSSWTNFLFAC